jgi:hypothetical protein
MKSIRPARRAPGHGGPGVGMVMQAEIGILKVISAYD